MTSERADRLVHEFDARIDTIRLERCADCVVIDLVVFVIGVNEFQIRD